MLALGLVALGVIALGVALYFVDIRQRITVAGNEVRGVELSQQIIKAVQQTQTHRGIAARQLNGDDSIAAERQAKLEEVTKLFDVVEGELSTAEPELKDAWTTIKGNWAMLADDFANSAPSPAASFKRHTDIVRAMLNVLDGVIDGYGLSIDGAADRQHLINAAIRQLPPLIETMGQARGVGSKILTQHQATTQDRTNLGTAVSQMVIEADKVSIELAKVYEVAPALKDMLEPLQQKAYAAMTEAQGVAKNQLLASETPEYPNDQYFNVFSVAIDSQVELGETAMGALRNMLETRETRLTASAALVGIVAVIAVALIVLVGFVIMRSIAKALQHAQDVCNAVAKGDLNVRVDTTGKDEISNVMAAMSAMSGVLQRFNEALTEIGTRHQEGEISHVIPAQAFPGSYREIATGINELARSHIAVNQRVVDVIRRYAVGDFSVDMDRLPKEQGALTEAMDTVKDNLSSINNEIQTLVAAAVRGDFSHRGDADAFEYNFRDIVTGINQLMEISQTGLEDAARVFKALAEGDLTEQIENDYEGLFAELREAANRTTENLEDLVGQIKGSTDLVYVAAREIAAGNANLSTRTEQQAANIEEAAASIEELTSTVRQSAENARTANTLAVGARETAVRGGKLVNNVVETMTSIDQSSRRISEITGVIDGIAFQTNILALNAAVEAARAGEQGRGFAVVAAEVRNLAQRSSVAAKEIRTLIADAAVKVSGGVKEVNAAGATMSEIVSSVTRVTDVAGEISQATQEQSRGIDQVNQTITFIDEATQQNAALVEQASAAAHSLEEQAGALAKAVAVFRTRNSGEARNQNYEEDFTEEHPNVVEVPVRSSRRA